MLRHFCGVTKLQLRAALLRRMSAFPVYSKTRQQELIEGYDEALLEIKRVSSEHGRDNVSCIAISKLKPSSDIMALYDHGVREFGENYVQELEKKSKELPADIKWHFVGGLQSGKCKDLGKDVANLYSVDSIDSLKKCKKLQAAREAAKGEVINLYLQINTSNEEQKSGYRIDKPEEIEDTVEYLLDNDQSGCLRLAGLMCIGALTESLSSEENSDFKELAKLKSRLDEKYKLNLELSMGMSNDFREAIKQGSTSVRIGTSIFGARPLRH